MHEFLSYGYIVRVLEQKMVAPEKFHKLKHAMSITHFPAMPLALSVSSRCSYFDGAISRFRAPFLLSCFYEAKVESDRYWRDGASDWPEETGARYKFTAKTRLSSLVYLRSRHERDPMVERLAPDRRHLLVVVSKTEHLFRPLSNGNFETRKW